MREALAEQATPSCGGGFSASKLRSNNASARAEYRANVPFVGGIELTVPRFGQRTLEDGSTLPGLAEHLVEAVGTGDDFAKSEDRYKQFIDSELPLAKAFAEC